MSELPRKKEPRNAITLLGEIRSGLIAASSISPEERIACTEYLTIKGVSAPKIASILCVSDRTIHRDRQEIRRRRRMIFDPEFGSILLGELDQEFQRSIECLKRIFDDPQVTSRDKIAAIKEINRSMKDRVRLFQSTGLLPTYKARPGEAPQSNEDWVAQLVNWLENQDAMPTAEIQKKFNQLRAKLLDEGNHLPPDPPSENGVDEPD